MKRKKQKRNRERRSKQGKEEKKRQTNKLRWCEGGKEGREVDMKEVKISIKGRKGIRREGGKKLAEERKKNVVDGMVGRLVRIDWKV